LSSGDFGLLSPVRVGSAVEAATGDAALLSAMVEAEEALARVQGVEIDVATVALDVRDLAERARSGGNPVIPLVAELTARDERVHRGATSQDILDTALMLVSRRCIDLVLANLDRAAAALAELAVAHRDTPMAGRTLTQHAVPTTFGLKVAGWRCLVLDARDRLDALTLPAQLGGAAGTLAALGDASLLSAYAREVGLAEPLLPWHVLRTPIGDLAGALAFTAGALGKIAADVLVLSRTEIGEVGDPRGGGSSAMPHKSNPVRAVLVAAAARQVPALASILFGSMVAEDERPAGAWHAEWQTLREALRVVGGASALCADLMEDLDVRADRMRANLALTGGLIVSERLVTDLGREAARDVVAHGAPPTSVDAASYLGAAGELVDRALTRR
jgi:3-carboxy-cis,cis-muconate cycloisomerase